MRLEDEVKITKLVISEATTVDHCPTYIWAMLDALVYSVSRATHSAQQLQRGFGDLERLAISSSVKYWYAGGCLPCIVKASASLLHHSA